MMTKTDKRNAKHNSPTDKHRNPIPNITHTNALSNINPSNRQTYKLSAKNNPQKKPKTDKRTAHDNSPNQETDEPYAQHIWLNGINIAYIFKSTPQFQLHYSCVFEQIIQNKGFSYVANLVKIFSSTSRNLQNITTEIVIFTVWFIYLLFAGSYVCKFVCQSVGWWVCFNSRDGASVGLFYYKFKAMPWILSY